MKLVVAVLLATGLSQAAEINEWLVEASGGNAAYGHNTPFEFTNTVTRGVLPGQGEGLVQIDAEVTWFADAVWSGSLVASYNGVEFLSVGGTYEKVRHQFYIPVTLGTEFELKAVSAGLLGGRWSPGGLQYSRVSSFATFTVTAVETSNDVMSFSRFAVEEPTQVPEPATFLLSGLGLLLAGRFSSRVRT